MISEFEYYHGVALRSIIATSPAAVSIATSDFAGRVNSYLINGRVGVHIKHSTKRLSPWQFSFTLPQLQELLDLKRTAKFVWLVLVCGPDGVVAVSLKDFASITEARAGGAVPLRIDRGRNRMYRVSGNAGALPFRKARGVVSIVADAISDTPVSGSTLWELMDGDSDSEETESETRSLNGISDSTEFSHHQS